MLNKLLVALFASAFALGAYAQAPKAEPKTETKAEAKRTQKRRPVHQGGVEQEVRQHQGRQCPERSQEGHQVTRARDWRNRRAFFAVK